MNLRLHRWRSARLTLGQSAVVFSLLLILSTAGAITLVTMNTLRTRLVQSVIDAQSNHLRTALYVLKQRHPETQYEIADGLVTRIAVPRMPTFADHQMVDTIAAITGGAVTVFELDPATRSFIRRTTNIVNAAGERQVGTALDPNGPAYAAAMRNETYRGEVDILGTPYYAQYSPIDDAAGRVTGVLYVGVKREQFEQQFSDILRAVGLAAGVVSLVLLALTAIAARLALRPLRRIDQAAKHLGTGEAPLRAADIARRDEIGDIARALAAFEKNAAEVRRLQAAQAEQERAAAQQHRLEMQALAQQFESSIHGVVAAVAHAAHELQGGADALTSTATSASETTGHVADRARQAAENLSAVASASEELATAVGDISRQAAQSASKARDAEQRGQATRTVVGALAASAERIGEVITLISTIAEQTNLLALNAAIESARAGDAGRGFAVVAAEVKALAGQTKNATQEISRQIQEIQSSTAQAVGAIGDVGAAIEEISTIAGAIAAGVEEQRAVVAEISRSTNEVAAATAAVSADVDTVRAGAQTTAQAAEQSRAFAAGLRRQSDVLQTEVTTFLGTVRAA